MNAALAALSIQEDAAGSDTITVKASDGRGGTDSQTIAVTTVAAPLAQGPASTTAAPASAPP